MIVSSEEKIKKRKEELLLLILKASQFNILMKIREKETLSVHYFVDQLILTDIKSWCCQRLGSK